MCRTKHSNNGGEIIEEYTIDYIIENNIDKTAYGFVYITTNLINGKMYIGQRKFSNFNWGWKNYIGSGSALKHSIKKYSKMNFDRKIISIGYNVDELNELEKYYIKKYNAVNDRTFYNIAEGGNGNPCARKTEEEIAIINKKKSISSSGINNPMYGKSSIEGKSQEEIDEIRKKQSIALTGRVLTAEHRKRISDSLTGRIFTEDHKLKIKQNHAHLSGKEHPNYGKKLSDDQKQKQSAAMTGRHPSEKTLEKMKRNNSGNGNPNSISVVLLNNCEVFDILKDAKEKYNASNISSCCRGKIKYSGRHPDTNDPLVWMYYDDYKLKTKEEILKILEYVNNFKSKRTEKKNGALNDR